MKATRSILDAAAGALLDTLGESTTIGLQTIIPRGAEPFVGMQRPLSVVTCRWARVAPGAVYLGGSPAALRAVLGVAVAAEAGADEPNETDEDLLAEASRPLIQAVGRAVLKLCGLPTELTAPSVQTMRTNLDIRHEVGQVPDAVALTLHNEAFDARIVVVFPSVVIARLWRQDVGSEVTRERGSGLAHSTGRAPVDLDSAYLRAVDDPMVDLPIDVAVELGRSKMPLAALIKAAPGERILLDAGPDDPVALTTEASSVAFGTLEVQGTGQLALRITKLPLRRKSPTSPRSLAEPPRRPDEPA